jgi:hypothetical protein
VAGLAALVAWLVPAFAGATDFTRYHTYQELTAALKALVAAHPDSAKLVSIGKTREGRDIWAVEIAKAGPVPADQRPALLITANLEADHLVGSELALFTIDHLLGATDTATVDRLVRNTFYVVPRLNADGAEQYFAPTKAWRRTNSTPFDTDNDGRMDEDGPEDLNKDGVITLMRVKDSLGPFMVSPEDPRLMKRADPARGEAGGYQVYWEGTDKDQDGFIAEDGPGGVDLNRNFMHQYPYFEPEAGRFMASEAETRALLDYVLKHRNIAAMLTYGESDNLIATPARTGELAAASGLALLDLPSHRLAEARKVGIFPEMSTLGGRGFGRGFAPMDEGMPTARGGQASATGRGAPARRPATTINAGDFDYFRVVSEKYRELTGIRSPGALRAPAGAFFEYGYYQYGVPSFSTPGWGLPAATRPATPAGAPADTPRPAGMPGAAGRMGRGGASETEGVDLRLLQWIDAEKVDGFVNWTPFTHPTLGAVEIGGFKPYAAMNPPAAKIADLGASHAKFALYLASLFPRVSVAKAEATALGGGLYRVRAEIENAGFLPAASAHAVVSRAVRPIMVQLGVPPETIVTGSEKTVFVPTLAGSGSRQAFEWIITAKPGASISVKVLSDKGGTHSVTTALK